MLEQLLEKLNSRDTSVRDAAMQEARALPLESLLEMVER